MTATGHLRLYVDGSFVDLDRSHVYTYVKQLRRAASEVVAWGLPEGSVTITMADCLRHVTVEEAYRLADLMDELGD